MALVNFPFCTSEIIVETHEHPETELVEDAEKQGEISEDLKKMEAEKDEDPSPRGVLEIPISGSDSDNSSNFSSSSLDEKSTDNEESSSSSSSWLSLSSSEDNNSPVQWKSMFDNIKKKSVRRLSSVSLMNVYEQSRKSLRWKFGSRPASEDSIDCGEWMVPKPSWRNFTYQELQAATKNFSPG